MDEKVILYTRDSEDSSKIKPITSKDHSFISTESEFGVEKEAVIVPVSVSTVGVLHGGHSEWVKQIKDKEVRELLEQGVFFSTDSSLKDPETSSNFAILMHRNKAAEQTSGRGGVLLKQDESGNWNPVICEVQGQEYLVDLKGTGTPQGNIDTETGAGVVNAGAEKEYHSLLDAWQQHPEAVNSVSWLPVPLAHSYLENGTVGQVARGIPTTLRPSYKNNEALMRQRNELEDIDKVKALFREIGIYLSFDPPRIPENHWTDNSYQVDLGADSKVVLTDAMEIDHLHLKLDPWDTLVRSLDVARDYSPQVSAYIYYRALNEGIQKVRSEISIDKEDDQVFDTTLVAEKLMIAFLAEEILEAREDWGFSLSMDLVRHNLPTDELVSLEQSGSSLDAKMLVDSFLRDQIDLYQAFSVNHPDRATEIQEKIRKHQRALDYTSSQRISVNIESLLNEVLGFLD